MLSRTDWVWATVPAQVLARGEELAQAWLRNKRERGIRQSRLQFTPDGWYQNLLGAEGEVAFRWMTGRPLPSAEEMAQTWKGADVDGLAIKTVGQPHYRLLFDESDLAPARALVLMCNQKPRFAIVGRIAAAEARRVRTWNGAIPRPAWMVEQRDLSPWREDEDGGSVVRAGTQTAGVSGGEVRDVRVEAAGQGRVHGTASG